MSLAVKRFATLAMNFFTKNHMQLLTILNSKQFLKDNCGKNLGLLFPFGWLDPFFSRK